MIRAEETIVVKRAIGSFMIVIMLECPYLAVPQDAIRHLEIPIQTQGFNPDINQDIEFHAGDWRVEVEHTSPVVLKAISGERSGQIEIPPELAQVTSIRRYDHDKIAIIGMVNGSAWIAIIVDPIRLLVLDHFLCYSPVVSPDGRYITFIKFYPAHGISSAEDHVMIYDLSRSAAENRPKSAALDPSVVGTLAYPPGVGNRPGDNVEVDPDTASRVASDTFFWDSASRRFVFASRTGVDYFAVVTDVEGKQVKSEIKAIPSQDICPPVNASCYEQLSNVDFSTLSNSLTLTFRGVNGTPEKRSTLFLLQGASGLEIRLRPSR